MPISIQPLTEEHIGILEVLDHSCQTDVSWKIEVGADTDYRHIEFLKIKLPREMTVQYPRKFLVFKNNWKNRDLNLVAYVGTEIAGYLSVPGMVNPETAWVSDLAVNLRFRRMGVGTALLNAARIWAANNDCKTIMLEMQSNNSPAVEFARNSGFEYCGYNDAYYSNFAIAVFFTKNI